ncbi:MAG: NrfD/PsrC family molybdoenzyme membrane anchor subunit [Candidatus Zixiibacteriota bacterium]
MNRVQNTKLILWLIIGLAAAVGLNRFIFGLGVTTNLTDSTPWGFWIGFDVMAGVALAGGGFVITAIFYMLRRDEFHDLVKPAVLTAFLGYLAVIFGLLFDLGLPWNIWHMMIYWNPHSPLFEVGWCVMLYTTVLLLEFSPVALERFPSYAKIRAFLMKFRFLFVLLGIMLSTLHQSSLGSLFLIMPFKLNALWYSKILPIQFLISAIALGLMMVSLESMVSHWLYRRKPATELVAKLGKAAIYVLGIYFAVKMVDILISGEFGLIFNGTWESNLFISEIMISIIIPITIFSIPQLRNRAGWLTFGSFMVVFGMIFNRINVGGFTMLRATGDHYFPSWTELTISFGVVSMAGLVFLFVIEKFNIWDTQPQHPDALPHSQPTFDYSSRVWLGTPGIASLTKYSLAFIISFAIGMALIPESRLEGKGIEQLDVKKARGEKVLFIDGNRDGYGVSFTHQIHIDSLGYQDSCSVCHHMNLPLDKNSGCWECHKYMYSTSNVFNHDWHNSKAGADITCNNCHPDNQVRVSETAKPCLDCHKDMLARSQSNPFGNLQAVSYADAMHMQCVSCHKQKSAMKDDLVNLAECASCHETPPPEQLQDLLKWYDKQPSYNRVVLPVEKNNNN